MAYLPIFNLTHTITNALTEIERARGFLEAALLSEDWLAQMQKRALVLEAHHTTHIEGTQLTLEQSELLLAGATLQEADPDDVKELLNYRQAFDLVAQYLGNGSPISEGLIREIHKKLVQGVRGNAAAPGEYRKIQNYVVNSITKEIIYMPPEAYEVPIMMAELVDWLNTSHAINPVLAAAIAQFQLVHIHPFLDGNGRSARLLSTLCLYQRGYDFKRLFTLSEYYDRNRADYYRAIQQVRENKMDLTVWLEYFCQGLVVQLNEVKAQGTRAMKCDILAKKFQLTDRQQAALSYVLVEGNLTIQRFETLFPNVTRRTLQRELKTLVEKGLLVSKGSTNKVIYQLHVTLE